MEEASKCVGGVISWTLFEYALHRWLGHYFHTPVRAHHLEHHRDPNDSPSTAWRVVALVLLATGEPLLVGFALGFWGYEWAHHRAHKASITGNEHFQHHAKPTVNFGVTTSFWDRMMGTYEPLR